MLLMTLVSLIIALVITLGFAMKKEGLSRKQIFESSSAIICIAFAVLGVMSFIRAIVY